MSLPTEPSYLLSGRQPGISSTSSCPPTKSPVSLLATLTFFIQFHQSPELQWLPIEWLAHKTVYNPDFLPISRPISPPAELDTLSGCLKGTSDSTCLKANLFPPSSLKQNTTLERIVGTHGFNVLLPIRSSFWIHSFFNPFPSSFQPYHFTKTVLFKVPGSLQVTNSSDQLSVLNLLGPLAPVVPLITYSLLIFFLHVVLGAPPHFPGFPTSLVAPFRSALPGPSHLCAR